MTFPDPLAQALAGAAVAVVRPGDTLIFSMVRTLHDNEVAFLHEQFTAVLPQNVRVCFIDQCSGIAVVRPDGTA